MDEQVRRALEELLHEHAEREHGHRHYRGPHHGQPRSDHAWTPHYEMPDGRRLKLQPPSTRHPHGLLIVDPAVRLDRPTDREDQST